MLPEAIAAMAEELARTGNASSLHASGRRARAVVEEARETVAAALGAHPLEVVFTSGGTEADNLAVTGLYRARRAEDPRRVRVLASAVEHHAVLDPVQALAAEGATVELLPVDALGRLRLDALEAALTADPESVALVSVMWANNEVGTVQPVAEVVALAEPYGIPVHSDAVQAAGTLPVDFTGSGLHCLSVSAHKFGGPVGSGALLVRRGTALAPVLHGGGQEGGVRSGTLDPPAVRGFSVALAAAVEASVATSARVAGLRDRLVAGVLAAVPTAVPHGDPAPGGRLPGIAHFTFPGCDGDSLLYLLDARGIECSTGSACQAGVQQASHVLLAMGLSDAQARGALRFSLGHTSTEADVDAVLEAIGPVVERASAASIAASVAGVGA
ncbi:cysteine desulfurase family protein [Spongisporangium articulatum]|uniref:cysteine desulfurase n=1 Tax=Spongisporangium articulatum TaxID=3362603 RepID=A0ABW8AN67_9ACTN